jgi:hypothetical protein
MSGLDHLSPVVQHSSGKLHAPQHGAEHVGQAAAEAIRALSDRDLDSAATVSLYGGAELTCQFVLEDHAVRHSHHHLARLREALYSSPRQRAR